MFQHELKRYCHSTWVSNNCRDLIIEKKICTHGDHLESTHPIHHFLEAEKKYLFISNRYLFISISVCSRLSFYLFVFLYVCIYLSVHMYVSIYVSIFLHVYLSIYQSIHMYVSIYLNLFISIDLSISICSYLSIYLSISVCSYLRYIQACGCKKNKTEEKI